MMICRGSRPTGERLRRAPAEPALAALVPFAEAPLSCVRAWWL